MSTCPQCAQILAPEARACPACGHDLHVRRLAEPMAEHDPEAGTDELLAAAIAEEGINHAPPPWVAPLEQRLRPAPTTATASHAGPNGDGDDDRLTDVIPAASRGGTRRRLFRRR